MFSENVEIWYKIFPAKNIKIKRKLVEDIDLKFFEVLGENDILFIDSSHIIRPQGDVLKEYLEIIPTLKPGVIVHVHDVWWAHASCMAILESWSVEDDSAGWIRVMHACMTDSYQSHWGILSRISRDWLAVTPYRVRYLGNHRLVCIFHKCAPCYHIPKSGISDRGEDAALAS